MRAVGLAPDVFSGRRLAGQRPCTFVCTGGQCGGVCTPGARRCGANGVPETCSAAGAWQGGAACPFVCTGSGVCGGQCVPNSMRCQGGQNQICDATGFWQNTGSSTLQLLRNGGFDTTPVIWTGYGDPAIVAPPATSLLQAHTVPNVLLEGGYSMAADDIFQAVTIPAGASSITLSFFAFVSTTELYPYPYDFMDAYVSDVGGTGAVALIELSNGTVTSTWTRFTAALPLSYAGRTVGDRLRRDHRLCGRHDLPGRHGDAERDGLRRAGGTGSP